MPFLPDPFSCHQLGIEKTITQQSRLGILAVNNCRSDRPTFGEANNDVKNTFSRILFPFIYAPNGAMKTGKIYLATIGVEQHQFRSDLGSSVDASFFDAGAHIGYQWFWSNGFNITATAGIAILTLTDSKKNIKTNEKSDVVDFLNDNSKTNIHPGAEILLGWSF